ncbi:MAG TPA: DNA primase [Kofleriaceae bacterium]|jgi:DNA primase
MIPDELIQQIRDATDIVAVIGQHVQLRKAGRNWKGLCPFHGERSPSFNVTPDKGFFHCFGCQKHGDVFKFVMEMEGKSFIEAVEQLAARANIPVAKIEENPEDRRRRGEILAMKDLNKLATAFYREQLAGPRGEAGRAYLEKRGVSTEIADRFQLGYAPAEWDLLAQHITEKRADIRLAEQLGLVAPRQRQGSYYDRIRDRLVCPVVLPGGEVAGFSSRIVGASAPAPDGSEPPKYINSPESPLYKKSKLLFGLAQAREAMQAKKRAVLVEGNFDVITLHQAGFGEVIAPLGTALTSDQINVLRRLTEKVVLLYDGDKAGYKATMHALTLCIEADVEVAVARRPGSAASKGAGTLGQTQEGSDPDSFVKGGNAALLQESIDRAMGGFEFFAFEVWGKAKANADARSRAVEDAARLLAKVASDVKRELLVHNLASALGVDVALIRSAISRAANTGARQGYPNQQGRYDDRRQQNAPVANRNDPGQVPENTPAQAVPNMDELEVIVLLADHPSLIATSEGDRAYWALTDKRLRDMYSAAREGQSLVEQAPVNLPKSSAELVLSGKYAENKDPRATLVSMAVNLEQRASGAGLKDTLSRMKDAGRRGDRELSSLLAQLGIAERKNDPTEVARLKVLIAEMQSGKQDD